MNIVASFYRQRIQGSVRRSNDTSVTHFLLERCDFVLCLLDGERRAVGIEGDAAIELLFDRGEARDVSLRFGKVDVVRGEFILRRGMQIDQSLKSVVSALQTIALRDSRS